MGWDREWHHTPGEQNDWHTLVKTLPSLAVSVHKFYNFPSEFISQIYFNFYFQMTNFQLKIIYYCPQTKLQEGNVFTPVCPSVHRGMGGEYLTPPRPLWDQTPDRKRKSQANMLNEMKNQRINKLWNSFVRDNVQYLRGLDYYTKN